MRRVVILPLASLFAVVVLAACTHALRARAMSHFVATQKYEDVYYVPPPEWLPVFSLGHDEALAGLLWTRALIYFGEEVRHRGAVRHAFSYADAILALDPSFRRVYRWIGTSGMYRPEGVSVEDLRRSVSYLERGASLFPNDGEMAWDVGASIAYELVPRLDNDAEKRRLKDRAVDHMQRAARLGGGPDWLVLTNVTELRRLGQTQQAIRHLEEMYALVRDEVTREQIELQLERLRGKAFAEAFRRANEAAERRRLEDFPYVEPSLHLLLGRRPPSHPDAPIQRDFERDPNPNGPAQ